MMQNQTIEIQEHSAAAGAPLEPVTPWQDWCALRGMSVATGNRLRKAGKGPEITRVSERRIGVRASADRAWLNARSNTLKDA